MKKNIVLVFVLLPLLTGHLGFGVTNSCQLTVQAEDNDMGEAKLFGDPVTIPAFNLRFVDGKTKREVSPSKISIIYEWKWLEYPYPEHPLGTWSGARDLVECIEPGTEALVPEFMVQPRGWYDGKYAKFPFRGRPSFTEIGIVLYDVGCRTTRSKLSPKEASKLKNNKTVTIEINCAGNSTVTIK